MRGVTRASVAAMDLLPDGGLGNRRVVVVTYARYKYLRRMVNVKQMDFEFALVAMFYLLVSPKKVYTNIYYQKQTKNQWARDDPAFLVLLALWLCVSSVGFAVACRVSALTWLKFLLWIVFVDCVGTGLAIGTALWWLCNRYLRSQGHGHAAEQSVEWQYAFDVHCNAFFHSPHCHPRCAAAVPARHPLRRVRACERGAGCYDAGLTGERARVLAAAALVAQYDFFSVLLGNTLWLVGLSYYVYITFLGYNALPFLERTVYLLYPIGTGGPAGIGVARTRTALASSRPRGAVAVFFLFVLSLVLQVNVSRGVFRFYQLM